MIFRAMVSAYPLGLPERTQEERVAFIEGDIREDAYRRLISLTAELWQVPEESIEVWNLNSEFELQHGAGSAELLPDQALFVTGWSYGQPTFTNGRFGHPLFFLARELDRVMSVYLALPRDCELSR